MTHPKQDPCQSRRGGAAQPFRRQESKGFVIETTGLRRWVGAPAVAVGRGEWSAIDRGLGGVRPAGRGDGAGGSRSSG